MDRQHSPPVSFRDRLAEYVERQAKWRAEKAEEYADDVRNRRSADGLAELAPYLRDLPDDDPRIVRSAEAYGVDNDTEDALMVGEEAARLIGRFRFNIPGETFDGLLRRLPDAFSRDREQAAAETLPTIESEDHVEVVTREERLAKGCPTCADFKTQPEAQKWFDDHGGSKENNVANLDPNRNGIACEGLPGTPSQLSESPNRAMRASFAAQLEMDRVAGPLYVVKPFGDGKWAVYRAGSNQPIDVHQTFEDADAVRRKLHR
jgi:hypothetical protein